MSRKFRLIDYILHIEQYAREIPIFLDGVSKEAFIQDLQKQRAVCMDLINIGEAAAVMMTHYKEFATQDTSLPWRSMAEMRHKMVHAYYDIDLNIVWETAVVDIPDILKRIPIAIQAAEVYHNEEGHGSLKR